MTGTVARAIWLSIGAILLVFPLLPIPEWVQAPDRGPQWTNHLSLWAIGLTVVALTALGVGRLTHGTRFRPVRLPHVGHGPIVLSLAVALFVVSGLAMQSAFSGTPHLTDEVAQLFQARVFASGRLAAPSPALPEFFLVAQTTLTEAGWVSQYPPAQSALLAVGMLFSAEWLVNPLLGGLGVVLVYVLARGLYGPTTALAGAVLWAASAWVLFMSATFMNHVSTVTFALAAWALVLGVHKPKGWHYAAAGCLVAAAFLARPLDAVATMIPLGVWLGVHRRFSALVWIAVGAVPLAGVWAYLNWRLYGSPLAMGYAVLYGRDVGLGFGMDAWGRPFTPFTALSNAAVAVRRLHIYLFEWPIPALLPLGLWALLARQRSTSDLAVATGILAAPVLYFFYWHSGFYPGPRFYYLAAPFLIIGTAQAGCHAWANVRRRIRWGIRWDAALVTATVLVLVWSAVSLVPSRWSAYQGQLATLSQNPLDELHQRGVSRALVLVPESWSSRVATKLWALGARPGIVERAFARVDGCELDRLTRRRPAEPAEVTQALERLIRNSDPPAPRVPDWPDPALRLDPAKTQDAGCRLEMRRDLKGFTLYGHLAWRNPIGLDDGIVFARDRYDENDKLFDRYAGWPVWRYAPPPEQPGAPPVLAGPLVFPDEGTR